MTVTPGERLAAAEEFMPADGAYEDGGDVYAAVVGEPEYDSDEYSVRVNTPIKQPRLNVVNSIVYGRVMQTFDNYALVELYPYSTKRYRLTPPSSYAMLRVSNVKRGYTKSVRDEFGVGDWIRAKISDIKAKFYVNLSTEGPKLGVIKAYCPRCRTPLVRKGRDLYCPKCKIRVHRKIAEDYGNPQLPR